MLVGFSNINFLPPDINWDGNGELRESKLVLCLCRWWESETVGSSRKCKYCFMKLCNMKRMFSPRFYGVKREFWVESENIISKPFSDTWRRLESNLHETSNWTCENVGFQVLVRMTKLFSFNFDPFFHQVVTCFEEFCDFTFRIHSENLFDNFFRLNNLIISDEAFGKFLQNINSPYLMLIVIVIVALHRFG